MSDDQTPLTSDQVKRYASFDLMTNSAIYAMARNDKEAYEQAVLNILTTVLAEQETCVSYLCYIIALYGQTLKMFTTTVNGDISDTLTEASLFDVLVSEDPEHFYRAQEENNNSNGSQE